MKIRFLEYFINYILILYDFIYHHRKLKKVIALMKREQSKNWKCGIQIQYLRCETLSAACLCDGISACAIAFKCLHGEFVVIDGHRDDRPAVHLKVGRHIVIQFDKHDWLPAVVTLQMLFWLKHVDIGSWWTGKGPMLGTIHFVSPNSAQFCSHLWRHSGLIPHWCLTNSQPDGRSTL